VPIVSIQCVENGVSAEYPKETTQRLADELGDIFQSEPGGTWVKMSAITDAAYAENHVELSNDIQPTFVEVLKRSLDEEGVLTKEADAVAECVSNILSRPKANVHVLYLPEGAGRVAFGGQLVRKESK